MENYSLSDIAAATGGEGCNSMWLIILFAIIFGANGFGRNDSFGNYATSASQQEILFGQQFQNLDNKLDKLGNGVADATFSLNNSIASEGRNIQTQLCAINSNIDNKFAAMEKSALEQRIAEQAQQINQLSMQQQLCGIPRVNNTAWGVYPYSNGCGCNNGF